MLVDMPRVLLADDSESIRKALRDVIRREGWDVCGQASNGEEAVAMAAELAPDLVVLDFLMPTMNGLAAAEKILQANPRLPIILYTLHTDQFLEQKAQQIGLYKIVSKHDVVSELIASIESSLSDSSKFAEGSRTFDIFRVEPEGPIWLSSLQGIHEAKVHMTKLAAECRGHYFVWDSGVRQVRAHADTTIL